MFFISFQSYMGRKNGSVVRSLTREYGSVRGVISCYPRYYAECRITPHVESVQMWRE